MASTTLNMMGWGEESTERHTPELNKWAEIPKKSLISALQAYLSALLFPRSQICHCTFLRLYLVSVSHFFSFCHCRCSTLSQKHCCIFSSVSKLLSATYDTVSSLTGTHRAEQDQFHSASFHCQGISRLPEQLRW